MSAAGRGRGRPSRSLAGEHGSGLLSSLLGLVFFLGFVLLAVQLTVRVVATSAITGEAHDAARRLAKASVAGGDVGAQADRERSRLRDRFARFDPAADITITPGADAVTVRVVLHTPRTLFGGIDGLAGWSTIERTVQVRTETVR